MVYMPSERKLARPYHGPYRVLKVTPTNAEVSLIDRPREPSIFVSLSRVRQCYEEMENKSWTGPRKKRKRRSRPATTSSKTPEELPPEAPETSPEQESMPVNRGPVTRSMARAKPTQ